MANPVDSAILLAVFALLTADETISGIMGSRLYRETAARGQGGDPYAVHGIRLEDAGDDSLLLGGQYALDLFDYGTDPSDIDTLTERAIALLDGHLFDTASDEAMGIELTLLDFATVDTGEDHVMQKSILFDITGGVANRLVAARENR